MKRQKENLGKFDWKSFFNFRHKYFTKHFDPNTYANVDTEAITQDRWQDVLSAINESAEVYERRRRKTSKIKNSRASFWQEDGLDSTVVNIISDGAGASAEILAEAGSPWLTVVEALPYAPLILRTINLVGNDANDLIIPALDKYQAIAAGNGDNVVQIGKQGGVVTAGSGHDTIMAMGGRITIDAGNGDNVIVLDDQQAGQRTVTTGKGHDYVNVTGTLATVTSGAGNDVVVVNRTNTSSSRGTFTVTDWAGDNTIKLDGGTYTQQTVTTGDGHDTIEVQGASGTITAGGGNDVIVAKPGTNASNGTFTITATGGDNIVQVDGGASGRQTITTGDGNDQIQFTSLSATVTTGAGDDVVVGDRANTSSASGSFTVHSAAGNNHIQLNGGYYTKHTVTTGEGHDTIAITGRSSIVMAGAGNNTIQVDGGTTGYHTITTDDGHDTVSFTGYNATINTGSGDDIISGTNTYSSTSTYQVNAGEGNNTIQLKGNAYQTINLAAGNGNNTINFTSDEATLNLGTGNNVIIGNNISTRSPSRYYYYGYRYNSYTPEYSINVAGGDNTIQLKGNAYQEINVTTGDGNDTLDVNGKTLQANLGDGDNIIQSDTERATITTGAGHDVFALTNQYTTLTTTGGDNIIDIDGGAAGSHTITTGNGNDSVSFIGRTATVNAGGGDDIISGTNTSSSSASYRVDARSGNNIIQLEGGTTGSHTITTGDGNDTVSFTGYNAIVNTGAGDDIISGTNTYSSTSTYQVNAGEGNNTIQLKGNAYQTINLAAGNGNNTINFTSDEVTLTLGTGNNVIIGNNVSTRSPSRYYYYGYRYNSYTPEYSINVAGGDNTIQLKGNAYQEINVTTGDGNDTLDVNGKTLQANLGDGDNIIQSDTERATITTGAGHDVFALTNQYTTLTTTGGDNIIDIDGGAAGSHTITTGNGNDSVSFIGRTATVNAGGGDDIISGTNTSSSSASYRVDARSGNNIIQLEGGTTGSHTITTGDGNDTVSFTGYNAIVNTGAGDDIISGTNTYSSTSTYQVNAGEGNNTIQLKGNAYQTINLAAGNGNNTINFTSDEVTLTLGTGNNVIIGNNVSTRSPSRYYYYGYRYNSYTPEYTINVAGGNNTIQLKGNAYQEINVTTGDGNDTLDVNGKTLQANLGDGDNIIQSDTERATITTGAGHDVFALTNQYTILTTTGGDNLIDIDGGATGSHTITTGEGDDTVSFTGYRATVKTGDGNDIISGTNTYSSSSSFRVEAGDGHNTVQLNGYSAQSLYITSGSGDDVIDADGYGTIHAGDGHNTIQIDGGATGSHTITTGNGDDVVSFTGYRATVKTGDGDDIISGRSTYTSTISYDVEAGNGNNVIDLDGGRYGSFDISSGDGDDTIQFTASEAEISTGDGDDIIIGNNINTSTSYYYHPDYVVKTSGGNNTIQLKGSTRQYITVTTVDAKQTSDDENQAPQVDGNNLIQLDGYSANVTTGTGNDLFDLNTQYATVKTSGGDNIIDIDSSATGSHTITTGDGHDTVSFTGYRATVKTGDGDDIISGRSTYTSTISYDVEAGNGNNVIDLDGGHYGSFDISSGDGGDTIQFTASEAEISTGDGDDIIIGNNTNTSTSYYYHPTYTVKTSGGNNTIQLKGSTRQYITVTTVDAKQTSDDENQAPQVDGNNLIQLDGYSANVTTGTGNDLFDLNTQYATVKTSGGDNIIDIDSSATGSHTITTGDGHDTVSFTGYRATVKTGDGNDSISGANTYSSSSSSFRVEAGDGHNTVQLNGYSAQSLYITSGSGDDVIDADGYGTIHAGDGHNTIQIDGGATGSHTITTGNGDDVVSFTGYRATVKTGDGDDIISGRSTYTSTISYDVEAGNGNNVIDLDGGRYGSFDISSGDGSDTIQFTASEAEISTGDGDDIIIGNNTNTSTSYYYHPDYVVKTSGGNNTIQLKGSTRQYITVTTVDAKQTSDDENQAPQVDGNNLIQLDGYSANVTTGTGNDLFDLNTQYATVKTSGGDNIIDIDSSATGSHTITTGDGDDTVSFTGYRATVKTGDGNDSISGANTYSSSSSSFRVEAGDGHNTVQLNGYSAQSLYITSGSGDDVIDADGYGTIHAGDGHNTIQVDGGATGSHTITTGNGDDVVSFTGYRATVKTGDGDDIISGRSTYTSTISYDVEAGNGNNVIDLDGGRYGSFDISSGDGDDTIQFTASEAEISTGDGDDIIIGNNTNTSTSYYYNPTYTVKTTGGDNLIQLQGSYRQRINISTGDGNDFLELTGYSTTVKTDGGNNVVVSDRGTTSAILGDGNDFIVTAEGNDSINAHSGDDIIISGAGSDSVNAGDGNDIINGTNSSSVGRYERDTITTGDGTDIVILGDRHQAYYTGYGTRDYAYIMDFSATDVLQLHGTAEDYSLTSSQLFYKGDAIATFYRGIHFTLDGDQVYFVDATIPELDVSDILIPFLGELSAGTIDLQTSDLNLEIPPLEVTLPHLELDIPEVEIEVPNLELNIPPLNLEIPVLEIKQSSNKSDQDASTSTKLSFQLPSIEIPTLELPEIDHSTINREELEKYTAQLDLTPDITIPALTLPNVTVPEVKIPLIASPTVTVPSTTLPDITVPNIEAPTLTVPEVSVPTVNDILNRVKTHHTTEEDPVYSIAGGEDAQFFTIDKQTGDLWWKTVPDFATPLDADGNNKYDVVVQATLGNGKTEQDIDTQHLTIIVKNDTVSMLSQNDNVTQTSGIKAVGEEVIFVSSFEMTASETTFVQAPFDGWSSSDGYIEVHADESANGLNHIELNDDASNYYRDTRQIYRNVETEAGRQYTLTFYYAPRPGFSADINAMDVRLDGNTLLALEEDGSDHSEYHWQQYSVTFEGDGTTKKLEFLSTGTAQDYGRGARLDSIQLVASIENTHNTGESNAIASETLTGRDGVADQFDLSDFTQPNPGTSTDTANLPNNTVWIETFEIDLDTLILTGTSDQYAIQPQADHIQLVQTAAQGARLIASLGNVQALDLTSSAVEYI